MFPPDEYQPLATYGPAENLAGRETLFSAGLATEMLRDSPHNVARLAHMWPGFQLVLMMHDGTRGRGLSLWRNQRTLDNYVTRHQDSVNEHVGRIEPDNPWIHHVASRRHGTVDIHLVDASMPSAGNGVVTWSPPGAVRISEIRNLRDLATLRDWWPMIASPTAPRSLIEVSGFQFFTAIHFPDGLYVTYLGFRSQHDLDVYSASDLHREHDGPFESAQFRAGLDITMYTGQLLSWFQREANPSPSHHHE